MSDKFIKAFILCILQGKPNTQFYWIVLRYQKTTTKEYVTENLTRKWHSAFELKQASLFKSDKCKIKKTKLGCNVLIDRWFRLSNIYMLI